MEIPKLFRKSKKAALPPGTLVHVDEKPAVSPRIRLIEFSPREYTDRETASPQECLESARGPLNTWIDVSGVHDTALIAELGQLFAIHPLVQEDIVHTGQRPKFEEHDGLLYLVSIMIRYLEEADELTSEQVSIVVGKGWVITFQEHTADAFAPLRERMRTHRGKLRDRGIDYLVYALLDAIVDNYFLVLERLGARIEQMEEQLALDSAPQVVQGIHDLRRGAIFIRKSVWPLREVLGQLARGESAHFRKETVPYLRDVYDHAMRVIETVETYRDLVSGLLDLHLSSVSNRMNEVMKTLTIIATIFIPLTFIAGVYGMNFRHMPELEWRWGYFLALGAMAAIAGGLLVYFRRRRWL